MKLRGCAYEKIGLVVNHISIIAWNKSKERLKNTTALLHYAVPRAPTDFICRSRGRPGTEKNTALSGLFTKSNVCRIVN